MPDQNKYSPKHKYSKLNKFICLLLLNLILFHPGKACAFWTMHDQPYLRGPVDNKEVSITDQDKISIRMVIESQIEAFRAGDGDRAFSFASPGVKQQFDTSTQFFNSVKAAYDTVLVPRTMVFEDLKQVMGIITQPVLFLASDGDTVIASYIMEKQENGDWKISGCYIAPIR